MQEPKILNWQVWLKEGDQYFKAASPRGTASRLNESIRYNLLSMSLESYVMAILNFHKTMPDNHTFTDLVAALQAVEPIEQEVVEKILKYENIQSICSLEKYHRSSPNIEELTELSLAISSIRTKAHTLLLQN